jgi:predicted dehydrogenase
MKTYAIVGSGFGLYGYIPAIAGNLECTVILPESARVKFAARPELAPFSPSIRWAPSIDSALQQASVAVIAVPPQEQAAIAFECIRHAGIGAIVLEKPVASSPGLAREVLESIIGAGRRCRVGYTLLQTDFAEALLAEDASSVDVPLNIEWTFMAHHFANDIDTWKSSHAQGGGALRFYGIHLVAFLALLGYREATHSTLVGEKPGEPERWLATMKGPGKANASVVLDCRSTLKAFRIARERNGNQEYVVDLEDPYWPIAQADGTDRRVDYISRLLETLDEPDLLHHEHLIETQRLWERIEAATQIERP